MLVAPLDLETPLLEPRPRPTPDVGGSGDAALVVLSLLACPRPWPAGPAPVPGASSSSPPPPSSIDRGTGRWAQSHGQQLSGQRAPTRWSAAPRWPAGRNGRREQLTADAWASGGAAANCWSPERKGRGRSGRSERRRRARVARAKMRRAAAALAACLAAWLSLDADGIWETTSRWVGP
jgi:hypothetical protein